MLYEHSLEIQRRFSTGLSLIRTGRYSTPKLAERLGVSIPTVSRYVTACGSGATTSGRRSRRGDGGIFSPPRQARAHDAAHRPSTKARPQQLAVKQSGHDD